MKQTQDNQRQADRGYGAELATDAAGALRGGAGLLISTAPGVSQMDASAPSQVLAQHRQTLQSLAELAQKQGAEPGGAVPEAASGAGATSTSTGKPLPAVDGIEQSREAIGATREGGGGDTAAAGAAARLRGASRISSRTARRGWPRCRRRATCGCRVPRRC